MGKIDQPSILLLECLSTIPIPVYHCVFLDLAAIVSHPVANDPEFVHPVPLATEGSRWDLLIELALHIVHVSVLFQRVGYLPVAVDGPAQIHNAVLKSAVNDHALSVPDELRRILA